MNCNDRISSNLSCFVSNRAFFKQDPNDDEDVDESHPESKPSATSVVTVDR